MTTASEPRLRAMIDDLRRHLAEAQEELSAARAQAEAEIVAAEAAERALAEAQARERALREAWAVGNQIGLLKAFGDADDTALRALCERVARAMLVGTMHPDGVRVRAAVEGELGAKDGD